MSKLRNNQKTLLVLDLNSGRSVHIPGRGVSDDLTDEEMKSPCVQKVISPRYKRARIVKDKARPVASPAKPVAVAEPNVSSDQ